MSSKRLDIVGLDVGTSRTRNEQCLMEADRIFALVIGEKGRRYLDSFAKPVIDLGTLLRIGAAPSAAYENVVAVVTESSGEWSRAAFVVDGNPQLFNTPVRLLRRAAQRAGWDVDLHAAVSCIDTILIDLDLCVEEEGLQIVDAARMVLKRTPINPTLGCLILQLATGNPGRFLAVSDQTEQHFEPLRHWLLQFHDGDAPFTIVRSGDGDEPSLLIKTTVGRFPQLAGHIDYLCSGYVPPQSRPAPVKEPAPPTNLVHKEDD